MGTTSSSQTPSDSTSMPLRRAMTSVFQMLRGVRITGMSQRDYDSDPLPRPTKYRRMDLVAAPRPFQSDASVLDPRDALVQECMAMFHLELDVLADFTQREKFCMDALSHKPRKVGRDFGMCCFLGDLPRRRTFADAGGFNGIFTTRLADLSWNDDCRNALRRSGGDVANQKILVRQALRTEHIVKMHAEISLSSLMSVNNVAPTLHGARVEMSETDPDMGYLTMLMEKFDMDLLDYFNDHRLKAIVHTRALQADLVRCLEFMADHGLLCVDLKPENAVVDCSSDPPRLRPIDFSSDFCGYDFVTKSFHKRTSLEDQVRQQVNQFRSITRTQGDADKKIRLGFMVVIFRCFCARVQWNLLGETVAGMYNTTDDTFNSVPTTEYQRWIDDDLLASRWVFFHYFGNKPGRPAFVPFTTTTIRHPITQDDSFMFRSLLGNLVVTSARDQKIGTATRKRKVGDRP